MRNVDEAKPGPDGSRDCRTTGYIVSYRTSFLWSRNFNVTISSIENLIQRKILLFLNSSCFCLIMSLLIYNR